MTVFLDAWGRKWFAYSTEPWSLYPEGSIVRYERVEVRGPVWAVEFRVA